MDKTFRQDMNSLFKEAHMHRSKAVILRKKCEWVMSHVHSAVSNGSANWSWSLEILKK